MFSTARTRRTVLAALILAVPLVGSAVAAPPAIAKAKIKCDQSGSGFPTVKIGNHDPIVNHNQAQSSHEHQFFGARDWLNLPNPNTANYADLAGKTTNCRTTADSAGYWTPTLRYVSGPNTGRVIPAQQFTAYYRPASGVGGPDFGPGLPFPEDTRLIGTTFNWTCGQFSQQFKTQGPVPFIPDCRGEDGSPGHTLSAHIDFPTCWNGKAPNHTAGEVGDTRDNADYAMKNGKYITKGACPAGFKGMTALRETIQFAYTGSGADVRLSSDMAGMRNGSSLHGDFWNTWDQPGYGSMVRSCITSQSGFTAAQCG